MLVHTRRIGRILVTHQSAASKSTNSLVVVAAAAAAAAVDVVSMS